MVKVNSCASDVKVKDSMFALTARVMACALGAMATRRVPNATTVATACAACATVLENSNNNSII